MPLLPEVPAAVSSLSVDKVLRVFKGGFTIPGSVIGPPYIPGENYVDIATGVPDLCFFYGIYSIDGGTTWQDFSQQSNLDPLGGFGYTDVWCGARPGLLRIFGLNQGISEATDILYKVALIAMDDHQWATYGSSDEVLQFRGPMNYTKILLDDERAVILPPDTRPVTTINHNLGYPPTYRGWAYSSDDNWLLDILQRYKFDGWSSVIITASQVLIAISNENNPNPQSLTLYSRIYYDD